MKIRSTLYALLALALFVPAAARAQGQARPQPNRPELERRVRARFAETVRAELGIDDAQLERVLRVETSFRQARQALVRREGALRGRMAPAAARDRTDEEARELLRELVAVREEETRLFQAEMEGLLEVLTPPQALRFYELREQMTARVRRVRDGGPGRGGPPGPRVGPPGGG
jgi:hypothetical protein